MSPNTTAMERIKELKDRNPCAIYSLVMGQFVDKDLVRGVNIQIAELIELSKLQDKAFKVMREMQIESNRYDGYSNDIGIVESEKEVNIAFEQRMAKE